MSLCHFTRFSPGLNIVLFMYCLSLHYDPRIPGISEELTLATVEEFVTDAEQAVISTVAFLKAR